MQSKKVSSVPTDFDIDGYIGMKSCIDLKGNHTAADNRMLWGIGRKDHHKDYPPPIPLLVRTGNLASHMPWVLKRHYTGDGRLILTEERVRNHEFFRAQRSDGRLMLHLVAVGDQVSNEKDCAAEEGGIDGEGRLYNKYGNLRARDRRLCSEWEWLEGA